MTQVKFVFLFAILNVVTVSEGVSFSGGSSNKQNSTKIFVNFAGIKRPAIDLYFQSSSGYKHNSPNKLAPQNEGTFSSEHPTKMETATVRPNRQNTGGSLNQNVETTTVTTVSLETVVQSNVTEAPIVTETPLQNGKKYSTENETGVSTENATTVLNQNVIEPWKNATLTPIKNTTQLPGTEKLGIFTECETPNNSSGYCVDIKNCPLLIKQLQNKNAWNFIRASICDTFQKDNITRVCCGKYDNFIIRTDNSNTGTVISNDTNTTGDVLPKTCGHQKLIFKRRIVGGTEASLGEYPWMAILLHKDGDGNTILGCVGFLIHTKYVLTAAHCTHPDMITQRGKIVSVLLGRHDMDKNMDCSGLICVKSIQTIGVMEVHTHPDFNASLPYFNDIALVKLIKDAQLTDYVQPICLRANNTRIPTKYYLSGWGKTEKALSSKIKLKIDIPQFDKGVCIEKYSHLNINLNDAHICAGGEHQKDSCTGDSGGPLMTVSGNETWYATGIVSFGVGCGMKGWPGVYTNLDKFLPWIKSQMRHI